MKIKDYITQILYALGAIFLLFLVLNLISPDKIDIKEGQILAVLGIIATPYQTYISQSELGKTAKTALRWFGIAFICFVIRIVFDGTAHVWLYAILFSVYGVVVFGLAIATQFLRKKRIEKINKRLAELNGTEDDK